MEYSEVHATNTGEGERQPLADKNKTDPGSLGKCLDPVYQSIYVSPKMAELYSHLSEHVVATHLCSDPDATWIHVCSERKHTHGARRVGRQRNSSSYHKRFEKRKRGRLPSIPATHLNENVEETWTEAIQCVPTLTIIPTAMWFGLSHHALQSRGFAFVPSRNPCEKVVRLLYCTHASYSELIEFVRRLRPRNAVACVVPRGDTEETQVQARLDRLVREVQMVEQNISPSTVGSLVDCCAKNSATGSPFMESFLRFAEHRRQILAFSGQELPADDPSGLDFVFS
ncbi:hypothetical protein T265_06086 [Opisthorchis viverrini]|uniref:DNA repair metallo-beta-lactamase domain-containing protein n=1 Tax=Opisthorchis viverrini TaxID=6198 RepID=A0A075AEH6_OPIVI|nr:hypothetical protein T265_06086 [Opisthorchis viverrini]KER26724.1 hypothetical protein T265_06086 [Opisthorchis viverrini]